jgi:hypothetical protein
MLVRDQRIVAATRRREEMPSSSSGRMSTALWASARAARAARSSSVTGPTRRPTSTEAVFWPAAMTLRRC